MRQIMMRQMTTIDRNTINKQLHIYTHTCKEEEEEREG